MSDKERIKKLVEKYELESRPLSDGLSCDSLSRRVVWENEALREALRLKELECEALMSDKRLLIDFVRYVSEHEAAGVIGGDTTLENDAAELLRDFGYDIHECKGGE